MAAPRTLAPTLSRLMRRPSQAPRRGHHRMSLPEGSLARGAASAFGCLDRARASAPTMSPRTPATIPAMPSVRAVVAAASGLCHGCLQLNRIRPWLRKLDRRQRLDTVERRRSRGDAFVDGRLADGSGDAKGVVPSRGRHKRGLVFTLADRHQRQAHRLPIFADFGGEGRRQVVDRFRPAGGVLLDAESERVRLDRR